MKVWSSNQPSIFSWCPIRDESRLFASSTCQNQEAVISLNRFNFLGLAPTIETVHTINVSSPVTKLDWTVSNSHEFGILASGHIDGTISLFSPTELNEISHIKYKDSPITSLAFNPTQHNVLLSISKDNSVSIWDLAHPEEPKRCTTGITNRVVQGEITSVSWHPKKSFQSILGLCDSAGLSIVWDLRSNRSTHSFADSTFKSPLSDISFSPSQNTILATASSDSKNSVISIWDLRNITSPMRKLHGHSNGVLKLEWMPSDDRVLLSSGNDGNIISWNVETGEQLTSIFETSPVHELSASPFIHGAILASTETNSQLFSFADLNNGNCGNKIKGIKFHQISSDLDVGFDGQIYQVSKNIVKTFHHQEKIAEASDFVQLIEALENKKMDTFVEEKISESEDIEKRLWEITKLGMNSDTFKEKALEILGFNQQNFSELITPVVKTQEQKEDSNSSSNLFGDSEQQENIFGVSQEEAEVFGEVFSPFRVLPKAKDDKAANIIGKAIISGNLQQAIDCAFNAEKYAEALLIASYGSQELFENTRNKYIRLHDEPLIRLVSQLPENKLDNFVRYAKIKDWKEIFAILCNYATNNFDQLCSFLGRRLIAEQSDYSGALFCFIASKNYDMVQQCLFQIYEQNEKDTSNVSVILLVMEKLCAMAGQNAGEVVSEISRSFLQHVIQSGHKEDAIRFVDAIPNNKNLLELKIALNGEKQVSQSRTNLRNQSNNYPQKLPTQPNQNQSYFVPTQSPYIPQPSIMQKPQQPQSPFVPTPNSQFQNNQYVPTSNISRPSISPPPTVSKPTISPPPTVNRPTILPLPTVNNRPVVTSPPTVNKPTIAPPPTVSKPTIIPPPTVNMPTIIPPPTVNKPTIAPPPTVNKPTIAPPPTVNKPTIVPPPTVNMPTFNSQNNANTQEMNVIAPPPVAPPSINQPPPFQPAKPVNMPISSNTQTVAPPPPASPVISVPPNVPIVNLPPPVLPAQNNNVQESTQEAPKLKKEATIDEVPASVQPLANSLASFINKFKDNPNKTSVQHKAIQKSEEKLPLVFGALRDGLIPDELIENLGIFVQHLSAGNISEAITIRKKSMSLISQKTRDAIVLMSFMEQAAK